jgi:ribosomal protein L40E
MAGYQEAKKAATEKKESTQSARVEDEPSSQNATICPNCNAELPELALFCPECGSSPRHCPKCGTAAPPIADICQECGAWLLEGQCKFCYAEIPDEALFCPECGKPKEGISCPHCGKLSIFDFCPACGKPVTEEAVAELQRAQDEILSSAGADGQETAVPSTPKTFASNQEARRWYNAHNPSTLAQTPEVEAELARLEALINSQPEPEIIEETPPAAPPARKSLFSDKQLASIRKTGAVVDAAIHKREEEERIAEEKRRAEEERQRQIREAQARKEELERQLRSRRWRCNAYGNEHSGPHECFSPSMGGQWV